MAGVLLSPSASVTEAAVLKAVARELGDTPYSDIHTNSYTAAGTSLTVGTDATTRYEVGGYIEWIDDATYDIALLTAVTATTLTIAVSQLGATNQNHSANARFRLNPRFFGLDIQAAINDALTEDLFPDIYAVYQDQLTPGSQNWYQCDIEAEETLMVYQRLGSPIQLRPMDCSQPFYVDATTSSTKKAVTIPKPASASAGDKIFFTYSRIPVIGDLSVGMKRIVEYGACKRLLEREASKDPTSMPSGYSPTEARLRTAQWYGSEQERLIEKEARLLSVRYPRRQSPIPSLRPTKEQPAPQAVS